jgi:hypothetical protein
MPWKCLPVPKAPDGTDAIHYTTVNKVFARWSDDGSLEQAFVASVAQFSAHHQLDLRILHGDGTNTVAKKAATALATRVTNTKRATKSSPSSTITVISWLRFPSRLSMKPIRSCCLLG